MQIKEKSERAKALSGLEAELERLRASRHEMLSKAKRDEVSALVRRMLYFSDGARCCRRRSTSQ